MKSTIRSLLTLSTMSILSASLLGACASTPDPAVICSAEWIAPRADKALASIEARAKSSMKTLSKASKTLGEGKKPGFLQQLALLNALNGMKKELTRGQGIKDLKTVAKTCNDPNIVKDAMHGLMERQGISNAYITSIENSPIYQSLIAVIAEPAPVSPNG